MAMQSSLLKLFVLSSIFALATAIKFDLPAVTAARYFEGTKCFSQYVMKDTLVLATVNIGEGYNQNVDFQVKARQRQPWYWSIKFGYLDYGRQ